MFKIKSTMYSILDKCELLGSPVALIAVVWLLISGSWLAAFVGIIALVFAPLIFALFLLPMTYFFSQVIKYIADSRWKNFMLWISLSTSMILLIALWGYCVFRFIVIPGKISIPSVLLGYIVATKLWVSLAKDDLIIGNYNICCFAIFAQVAFISSVVLIIKLQKINGPIILSYLIAGFMTIIALIVVWPKGKGYSELDIAKVFLKNL